MFITSALTVLLAMMLGVGEMAWLAFVLFWMVWWSWQLAPRRSCLLPLFAGALIMTAHVNGYKLYGAPKLVETHPLLLLDPLEVARFEPPNIVVAKDGSRHALRHFSFSPAFVAKRPDERDDLLRFIGHPLLFLPDDSMPSGYVSEYRCRYSCGNTWFPSLLPARLPNHLKCDMALALRDLGEHGSR